MTLYKIKSMKKIPVFTEQEMLRREKSIEKELNEILKWVKLVEKGELSFHHLEMQVVRLINDFTRERESQ